MTVKLAWIWQLSWHRCGSEAGTDVAVKLARMWQHDEEEDHG